MKFTIQWLTLAIFVLITDNVSYGQNACTLKLADAQALFEAGQIEEIPSILDSCMHNGFTKDEKIQAYRLLIQVYLFDYNPVKANAIMSQMLHEIKYYKLQPSDPVEFIELYNTYKMFPTWGIGLTTQFNISSVTLIKNYSITSSNTARKTYQIYEPGWNAGVNLNRYLTNKLWLTANITYQSMAYSTHEWLTAKDNEPLIFREINKSFSIPVMINFSLLNNKVSPIIFAGAGLTYLLQSHATLIPGIPTDYSFSGDVTGTRTKISAAVLTGIGLSVKSISGLFQISVGYDYNLNSYTKNNSRYSNLENILTSQHLDDNFKLNNIYLSISYAHLFYRIKKKQIK